MFQGMLSTNRHLPVARRLWVNLVDDCAYGVLRLRCRLFGSHSKACHGIEDHRGS